MDRPDQKLVQRIPVVQRWGILGSKRSMSLVSVVPSITGKVRSVAVVVPRDDVTSRPFQRRVQYKRALCGLLGKSKSWKTLRRLYLARAS